MLVETMRPPPAAPLVRLAPLLLLGAVACAHGPDPNPHTNPIQGVWEPTVYKLATGEAHEITGHIFFTQQRWTVLFFVRDQAGVVRRGSAEGGRYSLAGNSLTFVHDYHLSTGEPVPGLPAAELRMEVRDAAAAAEEPVTVAWEGEQMTVAFPSGNAMTFRRLE